MKLEFQVCSGDHLVVGCLLLACTVGVPAAEHGAVSVAGSECSGKSLYSVCTFLLFIFMICFTYVCVLV